MTPDQQAKHDEVMREAFETWAGTYYRNEEKYSRRDYEIGRDAWKAAIAQLCAKPDSAEQVPSRSQINDWMRESGWQNSDIRQADLDKVERVVRAALHIAEQMPSMPK